jgi:hypothetical protein
MMAYFLVGLIIFCVALGVVFLAVFLAEHNDE